MNTKIQSKKLEVVIDEESLETVSGGLGYFGVGASYRRFSAAADALVDNQIGTVDNGVVQTSLGQQALSSLADQLCRSTNGAVAYLGDADGDGEIGCADFAYRVLSPAGLVNEAVALRAVAGILTRLEAFSATSANQVMSPLGSLFGMGQGMAPAMAPSWQSWQWGGDEGGLSAAASSIRASNTSGGSGVYAQGIDSAYEYDPITGYDQELGQLGGTDTYAQGID